MKKKKKESASLPSDATQSRREAIEGAFESVYEDLRRIAKSKMSAFHLNDRDRTIQPTAVVHDAFMRVRRQDHLVFETPEQLRSYAAVVIYRALIDYMDKNHTKCELDENLHGISEPRENKIAIKKAITALAKVHPRQARILELKYFGQMTYREIAATLGISEPNVRLHHRNAKKWMREWLDRFPPEIRSY